MKWKRYLPIPKQVLLQNEFNIYEPESGSIFPADEIDMVIVPLLVFDKKVTEVGYGKGFLW